MRLQHALGPPRLLLLSALVLGLSAAKDARAHATGLSYLDLRVDGSTIRAEFDVPATDLTEALDLDADRNRLLEVADIEARDREITEWLGRSLKVKSNGVDCHATAAPSQLRENTLLTARATYQCEAAPKNLFIRVTFGDAIGDGFATYLRLATTPPHDAVLNASNLSASFDLVPAGHESGILAWLNSSPARHVVLGVEHILTGYDHILFLLALLMLGGSLRRVIGIATAFTVAHSITISMAILGTVSVSSRFVESAIAASIAYVAVENYWHARPFPPGERLPFVIRWRWALTFAFGLIHGFGFASAIGDLGLPKSQLPLAVGLFNLGVELGQVAIILVALPLVSRLESRRWYRPAGVKYVSMAIFGLAVYWLGIRAVGA